MFKDYMFSYSSGFLKQHVNKESILALNEFLFCYNETNEHKYINRSSFEN